MSIGKRSSGILVVAILCAAAVIGVQLRRSPAAAAAPERPEAPAESARAFDDAADIPIPVVGAPVVRDTLVVSVRAEGIAEAGRASTLFSEVSGRIVEIAVREGQRVSAQALLARVDPTPYRWALTLAEAELAKARSRYAEATLFLGEIADSTTRAAREAMARVQSGLVDAEIGLVRAQRDLERSEVRAPFAGRVANLAVGLGRHIAPGDSICAILDLSEVRVAVRVLESELAELAEGRAVQATFLALPDTAFGGRVASINPVVEPRTRSARAVIALTDPDPRVRPGMYAQVRIAARSYPDRLQVPRAAVLEREGATLVFLFEPVSPGADVGVARWTYVEAGVEAEAFVEVRPVRGAPTLERDDVVLVDGHVTLTHGARVRLVRD